MAIQDLSGRNAARARREAQINGKAALPAKASVNARVNARAPETVAAKAPVAVTPRPTANVASRPGVMSANSGREASRARRHAMSTQGKVGVATDRRRVADAKRTARSQAQDCGCGCNGGGCDEATTVSAVSLSAPKATNALRRNEVKMVTASSAGRINSRLRREALAAHGKAGADAYRKGISSAQMVKHQNPDISGRDLARTVRSQRCSSGGSVSTGRSVSAGRRRPEPVANGVSGTKVSHSDKTTGDETGLCRAVTGTDYFSSDVFAEFCQKDAPSVPRKVESSENLSGGVITTSALVDRSDNVTGNERGSCRNVTGVEYVGREQYDDFCNSKPEPGTAKVSFSQTTRGQIISGSKPARAKQVSGNEVGTCQAVTGTPYAGIEQFREYCKPDDTQQIEARSQRLTGNGNGNAGRDITGLQPGFSGLTGAGRGACRDVSGTAYTGITQLSEVCEALPAQIGESDFPRPLAGAPWGAFSILPTVHASQPVVQQESVTGTGAGTRKEQSRISGTFSLGEGKVTGSADFRSNVGKARAKSKEVAVAPVAAQQNAVKVRGVTGEGMALSMKITGNDWSRGEHTTGTEGTSAVKRNPTRRGPISAMQVPTPKRNEEVESSNINVTGGGGTSDKGSLITLSGGARG